MITGRVYTGPGDRLSGYKNPRARCVVLLRWRAAGRGERGGSHNVLVEYANGERAVIPFHRRLRVVREDG